VSPAVVEIVAVAKSSAINCTEIPPCRLLDCRRTATLAELGLNPLVGNAFRPRRGGENRDAA
jgi:hypothetical protein